MCLPVSRHGATNLGTAQQPAVRFSAMVKAAAAESEESRRRNQRYRMYLMLAAQGATNWVPKLSLASLLPLVVRRPAAHQPAPTPPPLARC